MTQIKILNVSLLKKRFHLKGLGIEIKDRRCIGLSQRSLRERQQDTLDMQLVSPSWDKPTIQTDFGGI